MVSEYEMDTMVSELTVANMVFGNSFTVLDPAESDFDFLEQLSPRYITIQKNRDGRHDGWKYKERDFDSIVLRITIDKIITIDERKYNAVNLRLSAFICGLNKYQKTWQPDFSDFPY